MTVVKPTAYCSGPMRGIDQFNFPAFDRAARQLRQWGFEVLSPAEHDRETGFDETLNSLDGFDVRAALLWDVQAVMRSDLIVLLPGWEKSLGAAAELAVARAIGIRVETIDEYGKLRLLPQAIAEPEYVSPLIEAHSLVHGDRCDSYGHPFDDFSATGRVWGAILDIDDIAPEKVGLCMVGMKMIREKFKAKRDNRTDMAGYAETVERVQRRRAGLE